MLSRRLAVVLLIVSVGSCSARNVSGWFNVLNPLSSYVRNTISNIQFPLAVREPVTAQNDDDFSILLAAVGKKAVVIAFSGEHDPDTEDGGLTSFDHDFLKRIKNKYRDSEVIEIDVYDCPHTASIYAVPYTSDKVHFVVDFRLTAKDFIDPHVTDIVKDLLDESNPFQNKMNDSQLKMSINLLEKYANLYGLEISEEIRKILEKFMPHKSQRLHSLKEGVGEVKQKLLRSSSDYNGLGPIANRETIAYQVDTDDELRGCLSEALQEYVILYFTDNSDQGADDDMKTVFHILSDVPTGLKIVQANANTDLLGESMGDYLVDALPSLRFIKRGKMQCSGVNGFDLVAIEAETSVLLSNIELIDSDEEFVARLSHRTSELILIFFTDNSLSSDDRQMKMYLSSVSISPLGVKVIQINVNTGRCTELLQMYYVHTFPSVFYIKRGKLMPPMVTGYDGKALDEQLINLMSLTIIVNNKDELEDELMTARSELIVVFFTNNSLDSCDCNLKMYLTNLESVEKRLKIIQINANMKKMAKSLDDFGIWTFPTVLFVKYGKLMPTRVHQCDKKLLDLEVSNLLSRIVDADTDSEISAELSDMENKLIIMFFTYNTLDDCDAAVKIYLNCLSHITSEIKIIKVNADTGLCGTYIDEYEVKLFPTLFFLKRGFNIAVLVGYNKTEIQAAIKKLIAKEGSTSVGSKTNERSIPISGTD